MAVLERIHRGRTSDLQGRAAEDLVVRYYEDRGAAVLARRWRGPAGELDLVFRENGVVVVVEVKSSRSFEQAACSLTIRQQMRIMASAEDYIGRLPTGLRTETRVDVALVAQGQIQIIDGALGL